MLNRDDALNLLAARVDGELTAAQEAQLEEWLAVNPDGPILAESMRVQDAELRRAFEPRRQAAMRTAERILPLLNEPPMPTTSRPASRWKYLWYALPPLMGSAIALAIFLVGLRTSPSGNPGPQPGVALADVPAVRLPAELLMKPRPRPVTPEVAVATIGQRLITTAGVKRRAVLPDGSIVYLDQNTTAELVSERSVRLERGRIFVEAVSADREKGRGSFYVSTPRRKLEALGTRFAVTAEDATMSLLVTQGSVKVEGANQPVVAGQTLKAEGGRTEIRPAGPATAELDWTRELIVAAETPLVPSGKHGGGALVAVDAYGQESKLSLVKFHIDVHLEDGFARTTIDQTYFNHESWQMEGTFYFPLPPDASLSRLAMYVSNGESSTLMEGGMAERDYARQTYERIRHARRDPALLEWIDGSTFKMRVFPLEARQEKRIILSYSQKLPTQFSHSTYRFPAGHSLSQVREWSFEARVKDGANLFAASPSHPTMKVEKSGNDLRLTDRAMNAPVNRDVVVELTDRAGQSGEAVRWSTAEQDGAKYLMMRYRPDLQGSPKRERRDWVFLFESSGSRDPLLARTQAEVVRSLLQNAEHDDTFALLTVGTRVRRFREAPVKVTSDNIREALAFLDDTHLIGALNLEQGLTEAVPYLAAGAQPYLVHLGGGVATLGEQRPEMLVKMLPTGAKYVGIAVGKRYSTAFMKPAAEATGGLLTQINPDEPVTWRGFEVTSALNTPRSLAMNAATPQTAMLSMSTAVAQGEEFTAVMRVDGEMPTSVTVRGMLNGAPFERVLTVANIVANVGHLPRTWAKLEIDRLLAESATKHKAAIIELSKAMYVMTPFTSLLVLENEAMYREFKVDRGRKDHWALYRCPEKIPTVYIPDPHGRADRNAPQFVERKPHANVVKRTVMERRFDGFLSFATPADFVGQDWSKLGAEQRDVLSNMTRMRFRAQKWSNITEAKETWNYEAGNDVLTFGPPVAGPDQLAFRSASRSPVRPMIIDDTQSMRSFDVEAPNVESEATGLPDMETDFASQTSNLGTLFDPIAPADFQAFDRGHAHTRQSEWVLGFRTSVDFRSKGNSPFPRLNRPVVDGLFMTVPEPGLPFPSNPDGPCHLGDDGSFSGIVREPQYYRRPRYEPKLRLFTDLASYAPGMTSLPADIQAVVEAEAMPRSGQSRGEIDPAARELINSSRSTTWRGLTDKDATGRDYTIHFDGQGRYAWTRRLSFGLVEQVVCDGLTILHLYPELGIGAKRAVSRFHRAEWAGRMIDQLPPADDLNFGHDVRRINERTVAIVPHRTEEQSTWSETHLRFDSNRLVERRWISMPARKELARETYAADDTVESFGGDGKKIATVKRPITVAEAPNLTPDQTTLVVLPLPLRSRQVVYKKLGLDPHFNLFDQSNREFDHLTPEQSLELLAAEFGSNDGSRADDVWFHRFHKKGDRRFGFLTLIKSAGYDPSRRDAFPAIRDAMLADAKFASLGRYLTLATDRHADYWQRLTGIYKPVGDDFVSNLLTFSAITARWRSDLIRHPLLGARAEEVDRALAFAVRNKDNAWGWCVLDLLSDKGQGEAFHAKLSAAWQKMGDGYVARYEVADNLYLAGEKAKALGLFRTLYEETHKTGALPALDSRFRRAFDDGAEWRSLFTRAADDAVKAGRVHIVVLLAWQCRKLGDSALASELLERALKEAGDGDAGRAVRLAAIEYLWSIEDFAQADGVMATLLADEKLRANAGIWRLASHLAEARGDTVRQFDALEQALDREFPHLPEVIDVNSFRRDYGALLEYYQHLAEGARHLNVPVPDNLLPRLIRAADRWRSMDPEGDKVCDQTAQVLQLIGGKQAEELAWDYLTTPLALRPNESAPWLTIAQSSMRDGRLTLADQCYDAAYAAEPTNAQILWDRAQVLERLGATAKSRELYRRIADGGWQPRFENLKWAARGK